MSEHYRALLIDIGNSLIKFALADSFEQMSEVLICKKTTELLPYIRQVDSVQVSSVRSDVELNAIEKLCLEQNTPINIVKTEAKTLGIHCAYEHFNTLGADRWLAILAAREITSLPVAVLDLGTANTCDIVIENRHLGGWIGPGFKLMRDSLLAGTQHVFADQTLPKELEIGDSTENCVSFGCLAAQQGFVAMAQDYLHTRYDDYRILITGGGQSSIPTEESDFRICFPNLVLKGLARFIDD